MIGIFIGIASVIALIGLGEGLRIAITAQFGFLGTDVLSIQASGLNIGPPGSGVAEPLSNKLAKEIERIDNVDAAINRYIESTTFEFNDNQIIVYAMSMPEGDTRKILKEMINIETEKGRLLKDGDTKKAVLGHNFAEEDNAFGKAIAVGDKVIIEGLDYDVVGIMKSKGSVIFDRAVIINEDQFLSDFGDDGTVEVIGVKVKDQEKINKVKEDIDKLLRKERDVKKGEENFEMQTPQQALDALNDALFAVQLFITIIAAISLVIGGIGITNTMYTAVLERTKEIGIMKSIGATNKAIFTLFFIESGLLGMVGGLIGIALGAGLAYGVAFVGRFVLGIEVIQAHVSLTLILSALAFSFFIGLIAGITPAIRAAKKNPVDALRFAK